jgi:hypothetical protein
MLTPEHFRGRVMGVFQLSNRGLHPLGQTETGLIVPLIGAREATFLGGAVISVITLLTVWRVPGIAKFRLDTIEEQWAVNPPPQTVARVDSKLAGVDS